jgi:SAM-dependent methyltransferase/uncharacterized protein YbaR (Trm112 family)
LATKRITKRSSGGGARAPPAAVDSREGVGLLVKQIGTHDDPGRRSMKMRPAMSGLLVLSDILACPRCHGTLREDDGRFACATCGGTYLTDDGIPIFVEPGLFDHDELDHLAGDNAHVRRANGDLHKAGQAAYFDLDALAEFEIERPAGTPSFYRFLLTEKFRRGVRPLGGRLDGWTALAVCGGSGMDAEFLARAGASVISSDISLGAAKRTRERARRHGIPIVSIVADVEHLPFLDRSIDLVYVHDGLHHLADPDIGLAEMARVADRGMSITEPARAALTKVAVKFGLALSREESGNLVARLEPRAVADRLREAGFSTVRSERYAMYYRHRPGRVFTLLSRPRLLLIATAGWRAANFVLGRVGNKLTIVAERQGGSPVVGDLTLLDLDESEREHEHKGEAEALVLDGERGPGRRHDDPGPASHRQPGDRDPGRSAESPHETQPHERKQGEPQDPQEPELGR